MKEGLTSSSVLVWFDSSKPVFFKTNWYASGMVFILMRPDYSEESKAAMESMSAGEEN
jgi:hypothetical protein